MTKARLGLIGTGWWACFNHLPTIQKSDKAELIAVADPNKDRLKKVNDLFGVTKTYTDYQQMLAEHKLDGVLISSPHTAHFENAKASLNANCHVLVEKPMTTNAKDARELYELSQLKKKEILVPCGWNFKNYTDEAAQLVAKKKIGKIEHVMCHMASALDDLFAGEPMLETAAHTFRPPSSTWADPSKAGGYGWGQMSHSLAWVFRVLPQLKPETVFTFAKKSPANVDYYNAVTVRCQEGAIMSLSGASTVPKHCSVQLDIRIFGTEGMLLFDVEKEELKIHRRDKKDLIIKIAPKYGEYDGTLPVKRFIDICCKEQVINGANALNGTQVVETLAAIYRSANSGKPENI